MEALYLLVPISLAIVALAAWIFLRMSDSGQFDDMEGPAHSILHDDDRSPRVAGEDNTDNGADDGADDGAHESAHETAREGDHARS